MFMLIYLHGYKSLSIYNKQIKVNKLWSSHLCVLFSKEKFYLHYILQNKYYNSLVTTYVWEKTDSSKNNIIKAFLIKIIYTYYVSNKQLKNIYCMVFEKNKRENFYLVSK